MYCNHEQNNWKPNVKHSLLVFLNNVDDGNRNNVFWLTPARRDRFGILLYNKILFFPYSPPLIIIMIFIRAHLKI